MNATAQPNGTIRVELNGEVFTMTLVREAPTTGRYPAKAELDRLYLVSAGLIADRINR